MSVAFRAIFESISKMACIYCNQTEPARFCGVEHVIPQAFGRYSSETPTLNCVCDDCNRFFGRQLDQLLARETPEGLGRYSHGQLSSERRQQRRVAISLADSSEAGAFAGMRVNVDGTTGQLMAPAAQFLVHNFSSGEDEAYLLHQIADLTLPEADYGRPGTDGQPGTWRCKVFASSEQEHAEMIMALNAAGIAFQAGPAFKVPGNAEGDRPTSFLVEIEAEIDKPHKRALAKVLMNFVAAYLGCDEARSARWDFLRRYVRWGEGEIRARLSQRPFWTGQETEDLRFEDDSINVRIENVGADVVGAIQFYNHHTYEFILVEGGSLGAGQEIGRRYTVGAAPIHGDKRPV